MNSVDGLNVLPLNISTGDSDYSSRPGDNGFQGNSSSHTLVYVLVPVGALILIAALSFLVSDRCFFNAYLWQIQGGVGGNHSRPKAKSNFRRHTDPVQEIK